MMKAEIFVWTETTGQENGWDLATKKAVLHINGHPVAPVSKWSVASGAEPPTELTVSFLADVRFIEGPPPEIQGEI
jgi:hypothetical protein